MLDRVDTVETMTDLAAFADSGASSSDDITIVTTPTFTGAAHDLDEIAMQAVRTAVAVLLNKPSFDVANVTLHDPVGPTLPRWTTYPVTKHPDCVHQ